MSRARAFSLVIYGGRAVLVKQRFCVLQGAPQLFFALVVQTASGERSECAVFYFQFLLLPPALLKNSVEGGKYAVAQLPRGLRLVSAET